MNIVSCPQCSAQYSLEGLVGVRQIQCQQCGLVLSLNPPTAGPPASAPAVEGFGDLELDLKEWITCKHCKEEYYPEQLPKPNDHGEVRCRRCHKVIQAHASTSGAHRNQSRTAAKASGPNKASSGGAKRKLVIDETLKNKVFAALKAGKANDAFQIVVNFADGRLEDAKKVFQYIQHDGLKQGLLKGKAQQVKLNRSGTVADWPAKARRIGNVPPAVQPLPTAQPITPGQAVTPAQPITPGQALPTAQPITPVQPLPTAQPITPVQPLPTAQPITPVQPLPTAQPITPGQAITPAASHPPLPIIADPLDVVATPPQGNPRGEPNKLSDTTRSSPSPSTERQSPSPKVEQKATDEGNVESEERGFLQRVAMSGRLAQGELFNTQKKYAQAREIARLVTTRDAQSARGFLCLGEALTGLGQEQDAFIAFERAARLEPKSSKIVRAFAKVLSRQGQFQESLKVYSTIAGLGHGEIQDCVALADLYKRVGQIEQSDEIMKEVLSRAPHSLEPQRELALQNIAAGDFIAAAKCLDHLAEEEEPPCVTSVAVAEKLVEACSDNIEVNCAVAHAFSKAGRVVEALRVLLPCASRHAAPRVQRELGFIYLKEGNDELAVTHLERSLQADPSNIKTAQSLGQNYLKTDQTKKAVEILQRAVQANPSNPDEASLLLLLASCYKKQGDVNQATEILKRARLSKASNESIAKQIEDMHRKTLDDRIQSLRTRTAEAPDDASAHLDLSLALVEREAPEEAYKSLIPACRNPYLVPRIIEVATGLMEKLSDKRHNVMLLRALYVRTKNLPKALEVVESYLKEKPDDEEMVMALIELQLAVHRYSAAAAAFQALLGKISKENLVRGLQLGEKLLSVEANRSEVWLAMARGRDRLSDYEGSCKSYDEYLNHEQEDWNARREIATHALKNEDGERVLNVMKMLHDFDQANKDDDVLCANACLEMGQDDKALGFLQRALDKEPDDPELQLRFTQAEQAKFERALERLKDEIGEGQGSKEQRQQLAGLYVETERREEAIALLQSMGSRGEAAVIYHSFAADHFARRNKFRKAEENLRALGKLLNFQPGSDSAKSMLYRIGSMYEQAGDLRGSRRSFLELFSQDMNYRDVADRLSRMTGSNVRESTETVDQDGRQLAELIEKQGMLHLNTIFDLLGQVDVGLDPQLLASIRAEKARHQDQQAQAHAAANQQSGFATHALLTHASQQVLNTEELLSTAALPDLGQFRNMGPLPNIEPLPGLGSFGSGQNAGAGGPNPFAPSPGGPNPFAQEGQTPSGPTTPNQPNPFASNAGTGGANPFAQEGQTPSGPTAPNQPGPFAPNAGGPNPFESPGAGSNPNLDQDPFATPESSNPLKPNG